MRRPHRVRTALAWLLFAIATAPACYTSEHPLDATPQLALDPALLGAWRCLGAEPAADDSAMTITIAQARDRVYRATLKEDGDDTPDVYEAYGSRAGGATVLNVVELDDQQRPDGKWVFVRYARPRPQILVIEIADEEALRGVDPSPAGLRRALARGDRGARLYRPSCVCVRVAGPRP